MSLIGNQLSIAIKNEQLSYALQRQIIENRNQGTGSNSNQYKSSAFRRVDHLLGHSWDKCCLILTENQILVFESLIVYNSVPITKYELVRKQKILTI